VGVLSDAASFNAGLSQAVSGPYFLAGLRAEPGDWLVLDADYSQSFAASSSVSGGVSSFSTQVPSDGAAFTRLRVSASARVGHGVLLGIAFIQRVMTVNPLGISVGVLNPAQQNYAATLGFEL
jgi:hypothetical protein